MKISVVIATYQRPDGKSPEYLYRALNSINSQTHRDFKLFLIGDNYEDNTEFESIATSILPAEKIYFENLSRAVERSKYTGHPLWCAGGVNAMNTGITRSLDNGFDWVAHLDHDDYWSEDHLESINNTIRDYSEANFIYTCSTYLGLEKILPRDSTLDGECYNIAAQPGNIIHSSVCFNVSEINLRYRDCFAETGHAAPADADLWKRMSINRLQPGYKKLHPIHVNKLTCFQPQEGV